MDSTPNPEYIATAKKLVGHKAALVGGGMSVQYLYVVKVEDVLEDGHAVVRTYWSYPYKRTEIFTPLMMSWSLEPLAKGYGKLPLGRYDLIAGIRDEPRKPVVSLRKFKEAQHG